MSERITEAQLKALVKRVNELTGNPIEEYAINDDGILQQTAGNFHIAYAYGGVKLEQNDVDSGVTSHTTSDFDRGYVTKRELYNQLRAFIAGLSYKKGA